MQLIPGVGVHNGFYAQFKSLALEPATPAQNLTAVLYELSNGTQPLRVVITGGGRRSGAAPKDAQVSWPAVHALPFIVFVLR